MRAYQWLRLSVENYDNPKIAETFRMLLNTVAEEMTAFEVVRAEVSVCLFQAMRTGMSP